MHHGKGYYGSQRYDGFKGVQPAPHGSQTPPERKGEDLLCGACLTVMVRAQPLPCRMFRCVNDKCAQRGSSFYS